MAKLEGLPHGAMPLTRARTEVTEADEAKKRSRELRAALVKSVSDPAEVDEFETTPSAAPITAESAGDAPLGSASVGALWGEVTPQNRLETKLHKSPGFFALAPDEQAAIASAVQGDGLRAQRAQSLLAARISVSGWAALPPADQTTSLQAFLRADEALTGAFGAPLATLEALPAWAAVSREAQTKLKSMGGMGQALIAFTITSPDFQALSSQRQAELITGLVGSVKLAEQISGDPNAVTKSPGFERLSAEEQKRLKSLLSVSSNLKQREARKELVRVTAPPFAVRSASEQKQVLSEYVERQTLARQAWTDWVGTAKASKGWNVLREHERASVQELLDSTWRHPQSAVARLVRNDEWARASTAAQAKGLRAMAANETQNGLFYAPYTVLTASPGFARLPPADQEVLQRPQIREAIEFEVAVLFGQRTWATRGPAAQATALRALAARAAKFEAIGQNPGQALAATAGFATLSAAAQSDLLMLASDPKASNTLMSVLTDRAFMVQPPVASTQAKHLDELRVLLRTDALNADPRAVVAQSPGFASLTFEQREALTESLSVGPELTKILKGELIKRMATGKPWSSRSAADQAAVFSALLADTQAQVAVYKDPLSAAKASRGWATLSPAMQERLETCLEKGAPAPLVAGVRAGAAARLLDASNESLTDDELGAKIAGVLSDRALVPQTASFFDPRPMAPYTLEGPTREKAHEFAGVVQDADVYRLRIGAKELKVYTPHRDRPSNSANGKQFDPLINHTIDQVARSFAREPQANLAALKAVTLNPGQNPADDYWAEVYQSPNFVSYMTAGVDGEVTLYPQPDAADEKYMASSVLHESGHSLSKQLWGEDTSGPLWQPWRDAVDADVIRPSDYAFSSYDEDVAETVALYQSARIDPVLFAKYRRIFPARFAILDGILGSS